MSPALLVLRPEPGAARTLAKARAMGLEAIAAPLFTLRACGWEAPPAEAFDGLLVTSANAVRLAGDGLAAYRALPVHAVGPASAEAARAAGFTDVTEGPGDGAALVATLAADPPRRLLHLAASDHVPLAADGVAIIRRIAYAADPVPALPSAALDAIGGGALVLLHSPRAATTFARLADEAGLDRAGIALAAISPAAAAAAGTGWARVGVAAAPRDAALLELAAFSWQKAAGDGEGLDMTDERIGEDGPDDRRDGRTDGGAEPLAGTVVDGVARPRGRIGPLLIGGLILFLLGAAAWWGAARWWSAETPPTPPVETPVPIAAPEPEPALPPTGAPAAERIVLDPEMGRRVSQLEQRLAELDLQSRAAVGNADRAEGLLLAFAARRALDRGVALGYLEGLLRQRFGNSQPQAVGTIIAVARQPVTLDQLHQGLQDAEQQLVGGAPDQGWWAALRAELGTLVTVRRQGTPSTIPAERFRRAMRRVESGQVDVALAEVLRMPGRDNAREWIDNARRYVAARRALDTVETAALLEPRQLPPPPPAPAEEPETPGPETDAATPSLDLPG